MTPRLSPRMRTALAVLERHELLRIAQPAPYQGDRRSHLLSPCESESYRYGTWGGKRDSDWTSGTPRVLTSTIRALERRGLVDVRRSSTWVDDAGTLEVLVATLHKDPEGPRAA